MISTFRIVIHYIIVSSILFGSTIGITGNKDNTKIIRDNIRAGLLSGDIAPEEASDIDIDFMLFDLITTDEKGNLYFTDIDYTDTDRATWQTSRHLTRTLYLATRYGKMTDDDKNKDKYRDTILGLINHWIEEDYQNENWWMNVIKIPNLIGEIGIIMRDYLTASQLKKVCAITGRGCLTVNGKTKKYTGANAINIVRATITFGALTGSNRAIKKAVKKAAKELVLSDGEGLKADGTFFQHGNRIYIGGYGIDFLTGMTQILYMLDGSSINFTTEQLKPLSLFITEGLRKTSFKNVLDPTVMGRTVSRYTYFTLNDILPLLTYLSEYELMPERDSIAEFVNTIKTGERDDYGLTLFNDSKLIVINNRDFYFSFHGGDNDMNYSETVNNENILSYNSSFPGVTSIMSTGREYINISPLFNYSLVPGTNAVPESDEDLAAHDGYSSCTLEGIYLSADNEGIAILSAKTKHEGMNMTVTCFADDESAYILCAGMTADSGKETVATVNQCFQLSDVIQNENTVVHAGIKYTLLDGGEFDVSELTKSGNYKRNNLSLSDDEILGFIFQLTIKNSDCYAYSIMGEDTDSNAELIVNNENVQAIKMSDGTIAAAFFCAGEFIFEGQNYSSETAQAIIYK